MGYRIGHGLEHGQHLKLRQILTAAILMLVCRNPHVLAHESAGVEDLPVQRPGDVVGIPLIRCLPGRQNVCALVCHCLDECTRQEQLRSAAPHEQPGNRGPPSTLLVKGCHCELAKQNLGRISTVRGYEPAPQPFIQIGQGGAGNRRFVEADQARLTALLKQPGQVVWRDGTFR